MTQFGAVRHVIAAPKSPAFQTLVVLAAVATAAAIRWFVDGGANGIPFVTFVPVVMLAAIFIQWPYAVLAALASLVTVIGLFGEFARVQFIFTNYMLWGSFTFIATFMIVVGHILRQTILELDAQSERIRHFNAELQHRTRNTLQMVRSLASRAARATDPVEFYQTLSGRLDAMAKANELLAPGSIDSCTMADLVDVALQPFPAWAVQANGPACSLAGEPVLQLAMTLHELGTNAMKYGALSCDDGRVFVGWSLGEDAIDLVWEERGGPAVSPPTQRGLGSRILSPGGALRAVDLDYRLEGLVCRVRIAAALDG